MRWKMLRERMPMKMRLMVVCVALASMVVAVAQTASKPKASTSAAAVDAKTNGVVGVNKFMRDVDSYPGRVQVEGIVKTVSAKSQSLGLGDCEGCGKCEAGSCAELVLPVRWTGAMPSVGQGVRVTGEVQKRKGKLTFVASAVEKVQAPEEKK